MPSFRAGGADRSAAAVSLRSVVNYVFCDLSHPSPFFKPQLNLVVFTTLSLSPQTIMAQFLRGKQAGIQKDLSEGLSPDLFVLDDVCNVWQPRHQS